MISSSIDQHDVVPMFSEDVGRRRLQQKGHLYKQGRFWMLRWREDQRKADGSVKYGYCKPVTIGFAEGRDRLTEKQAQRKAWDDYLSKLDANNRTPQSIMTVAEFVERRFLPEHVAMLKPAGKTHYKALLPHVLLGIPEKRRSFKDKKMKDGKWGEDEDQVRRHCGIGKLRLRDVTHEPAQKLVSEAINRGYSVQTARHIKNVVSAVFTYAAEMQWFSGRNPAEFVRLPEMEHRTPQALSFEQLKALLQLLEPVPRAMVLCASLTSMNIAEICGLRWKRLNLTTEPIVVDGEAVPGLHVAVREQWYLRQWGSVKAKARRRNLPIPSILADELRTLKQKVNPQSQDDPVFAGAIAPSQPLDQQAMLNDHVRKASAAIGVPALGWHDLRRTFATLADQLGLSIGVRKALMGHSRAEMTLAYTHTSSQEATTALELLAEKVKGPVQ